MSVMHLAIQPPLQLSAVTSCSEACCRRCPSAADWALRSASVGMDIGMTVG